MNPSPWRMRGFSLIEMMVSLLIGLFLLLAIYTVFATVRTSLSVQQGSAQLQDDQRLSMTILANEIQSAGFFPNPTTYTPVTAFPANATFLLPGQIITGTHSAAAPGDSLTVRMMMDGGTPPKALNCLGSAGTANSVETDRLQVNAAGQLVCAANAAAVQPLAGGSATTNPAPQKITQMQVLYGIDATGAKSVTEYLDASAVTTQAQWTNVISVYVTLTFANPNAKRFGEPATFSVSRAIALQNTAAEG